MPCLGLVDYAIQLKQKLPVNPNPFWHLKSRLGTSFLRHKRGDVWEDFSIRESSGNTVSTTFFFHFYIPVRLHLLPFLSHLKQPICYFREK